MDQDKADAILAKITTGTKDICTDADLVVEAALEDMAIKKQTFKELQEIVPAELSFCNKHIFIIHYRRLVQVLTDR